MRITHSLVQVAVALLAAPRQRHWGYELSKAAGVSSGVLYPMLTRILAEGWLSDGWEDPLAVDGRPPRRYYEITDNGLRELGGVVERAHSDARFARTDLGWAR